MPSWSFSVEAGTTAECRLVRGAPSILPPYVACTSPQTYDLSAKPDGVYKFWVRARDAAGNVSAAATSTYILDRTAPPAPTIDSSPSSPGNSTSPSWSFSIEAGTTAECQFYRGTPSVLPPFVACSSPQTYDLSGEPDGDYTFRVRATDAAGNTGPVASDTYTLDTTGPDVTITSSPNSPGNDLTPTWDFTVAGRKTSRRPTAECQISSDAGVIQPYAPCGAPVTFDLGGRPDGGYTFQVRATDWVGNVGPVASSTYVLDTMPPAAPVITSAPASPGADTHPSWSFTAEAGATTECELVRDGSVVSARSSCSSPVGFDLSSQPNGNYTFRVRALDPVGNTGPDAVGGYSLAVRGGSVTPPGAGDGGSKPPGNGGEDGPGGEGGNGSEGSLDVPQPWGAGEPIAPPLGTGPESGDQPKGEAEPRDGGEGTKDGDQQDPEEASPAPSPSAPSDHPRDHVPKGTLRRFVANAGLIVGGLLRQPAFPLILFAIVLMFLVVQSRVDRRDPKLALAPVSPDPMLDFEPHVRGGQDMISVPITSKASPHADQREPDQAERAIQDRPQRSQPARVESSPFADRTIADEAWGWALGRQTFGRSSGQRELATAGRGGFLP